MSTEREMPKWRCHKEVWALKFTAIQTTLHGVFLVPEDAGFAPIKVSMEWVTKHDPKVPGYYVVYKDGYKSYSPVKPFEDGYTKLGEPC